MVVKFETSLYSLAIHNLKILNNKKEKKEKEVGWYLVETREGGGV